MKKPRAIAFVAVAIIILLAGWIGVPNAARAVDLTAPTQVIARVGGACTLATTDLDFGTLTASLSGGVSQTDANGTVSITCTNALAFSVVASVGTNSTGFTRRMQSASNAGVLMNYDIYTTAARTTSYPFFGTTQSYTGDGSPLTITSYGRIPGQTLTGVGAFKDTLTWSVTY